MNKNVDLDDVVRIFSKITYYRWLKEIKWSKSSALAGLDSYSAAGFEALDTLDEILSEVEIPLLEKDKLRIGIHDMRHFLKFDFKKSLEDSSSSCGYHCESFSVSQQSKKKVDDEEFSSKCKLRYNISNWTNIKSQVLNLMPRITLARYQLLHYINIITCAA